MSIHLVFKERTACAMLFEVDCRVSRLQGALEGQVVEATGFEPTTAWLQTRCSTN